jgi:Flp pilus assembly protein TadD
VTLFKLERLGEAVEAYERAVERAPDEGAYRAGLGLAYARLGRTEEGIVQYEKAIELEATKDNADLRYHLGVALEKVQRPLEALAAFSVAAELRPTHVETHRRIGRLLVGLGRYREACETFRRAVSHDLNDAELRYELGSCLARIGERDAALDQLGVLRAMDRGVAQRLAEVLDH